MKKIPTLFERDPNDRKHVLPEVTPGCEWVLNGEGVATRKFDGTCVLIRDDHMFARREVKPGKPTPPDFEPAGHDDTTGKTVGWVPVTDHPDYDRHWEAFGEGGWADGTYELCGPKVNGNPEGYDRHVLIRHGEERLPFFLESGVTVAAFLACEAYLLAVPWEGIVWHHPDGRMAKLKRRDFR